MSEALKDRPDVVVFPPVVPLAILVLAIALQWFAPLNLLAAVASTPRIVVGTIIALAGALVVVSGQRALARRGTNVNPSLPTLALASDGIYRFTRNPMYVGGMTALAGIAPIFSLDWLILLMIPAACILHIGIVSREERYLARKFGEEYRSYEAQVPRYMPFIG
jgi:protein-S-isoprenylcysteine O-methyltransferase Ste14